ncbi:hypothetical protein [Nocardia arthritidis]|uniref:Uncharacterized protein n=1 Tax=Nocardia arthritidis TaxID=228602 RepID=A0A6G9Y6N0_9NOCA|nr:hypothetical protein [Nocardia arthritidis]QIS08794.1 hypothetical protein F5544_04400 [Nocardia arthritidis]
MKSLPSSVTQPMLELLGWLGWIVTLMCISRIIWAAALFIFRSHRYESIEGLLGSLLGGVVVGSAGLIAAALYAPL